MRCKRIGLIIASNTSISNHGVLAAAERGRLPSKTANTRQKSVITGFGKWLTSSSTSTGTQSGGIFTKAASVLG
jgi:hypothetical protein